MNLIFKPKNIKVSEIFDQLNVWCKDKPVFLKELLTEQVKSAIKLFEDSTIRPLPDIHIYFPVKNLDFQPDFLLTLLNKYKECENILLIFNFGKFINCLENTGLCEEKLFTKYVNDMDLSNSTRNFFCESIRKYVEKIDNDRLKMMADILSIDMYLSNKAIYHPILFDHHLLEIDRQRMAEKGYQYYLFNETDKIVDVLIDKKFHDFVTSSLQTEFNFIFGHAHSIAVFVQKKDGKLSFVAINSFLTEAINIEDLKYFISEKSDNSKQKSQNPLTSILDIKVINLSLEIQADFINCRIFARDSLINLIKNEAELEDLHKLGEYGKSVFFSVDSEISVTDIVGPDLVRFSQVSVITDKYKESFKKRKLLKMNVGKEKSKKRQTWEEYRAKHSRNKKVLNKYTGKVEEKNRNESVGDKRVKLLMNNRNYLYAKLHLNNTEEMRSYLLN